MKIYFYINILSNGGAERVIANLASQFAKDGQEVAVITSFKTQGEYVTADSVCRYELEETDRTKDNLLKKNIRRIYRLREILKRDKPDVLVSFMAEPNFRAILATVGLKTKNIISVRNDPNVEYKGKIGYIIGKLLLPSADGCVFQTEEARKWFPIKLQNKSTVILNPVKEEFYETKWEPILGRIITCGRLEKQKNHKMLIDAFLLTNDRIANLELWIYGKGSLQSELEEYIKQKNANDRVYLQGNVSNVSKVIGKANVFILSSDYEGMPNALMEAMAVGIPCIVTDCPCGGPRMLIKDGEDGILIPVKSTQDLANELYKVLVNNKYAEKLANNAKIRALEFKPNLVFNNWKNYIEYIIND